jgi:hypothetical protein
LVVVLPLQIVSPHTFLEPLAHEITVENGAVVQDVVPHVATVLGRAIDSTGLGVVDGATVETKPHVVSTLAPVVSVNVYVGLATEDRKVINMWLDTRCTLVRCFELVAGAIERRTVSTVGGLNEMLQRVEKERWW